MDAIRISVSSRGMSTITSLPQSTEKRPNLPLARLSRKLPRQLRGSIRLRRHKRAAEPFSTDRQAGSVVERSGADDQRTVDQPTLDLVR